jgi:hypothetical protein
LPESGTLPETKNRMKGKAYSRIKFTGILAFPFILYFIPVDRLDSSPSICLIKTVWGRECYGCGITRAIISAVQLDFEAALRYNKLVVAVLPLFLFVWVKTLIQLWNGKP